MTEFVELALKRNRGWPWPEDSWGLTPMFGEDGWCRSCGVPRRPQSGSLVLRRKGLVAEGVWVPNWRFDAICMAESVAAAVAGRFAVELLPVEWRGKSPGGAASQIVAPSVGERWFDPDELRAAAVARHGVAGAACSDCGVWRWMPLAFGMLPPLRIEPALGDVDVAASPEWFGDGMQSFRQILVRRELAEVLVAASPKDVKIREPVPAGAAA